MGDKIYIADKPTLDLVKTDTFRLLQGLNLLSPDDWSAVQAEVRDGTAPTKYPVGTVIRSLYRGAWLPWIVLGHNVDTPVEVGRTKSMTLQTLHTIGNIQFDAPEPNNADSQRKSYGNNRYLYSAVRQWLNSPDATFQWVAQHADDVIPTTSADFYQSSGFLYRLDPAFVAVLGNVTKKTGTHSVDGGGQDTITDKVFLISQYEAGLGSTDTGDTTGEIIYPLYEGAPASARIKTDGVTASHWWLRSPGASNAYDVRRVDTTGAVNYYGAYGAIGAAPACVII